LISNKIMLYATCPTCGTTLGNKQLVLEKEKNKICSNPELSNDEKEAKIKNAINNLKVRRYCCKMRLISYLDTVQIIM
jgi:DNA-directed RNA polymerase subunit N (RpoN/RPB10)